MSHPPCSSTEVDHNSLWFLTLSDVYPNLSTALAHHGFPLHLLLSEGFVEGTPRPDPTWRGIAPIVDYIPKGCADHTPENAPSERGGAAA